jgi:hypothetical protein
MTYTKIGSGPPNYLEIPFWMYYDGTRLVGFGANTFAVSTDLTAWNLYPTSTSGPSYFDWPYYLGYGQTCSLAVPAWDGYAALTFYTTAYRTDESYYRGNNFITIYWIDDELTMALHTEGGKTYPYPTDIRPIFSDTEVNGVYDNVLGLTFFCGIWKYSNGFIVCGFPTDCPSEDGWTEGGGEDENGGDGFVDEREYDGATELVLVGYGAAPSPSADKLIVEYVGLGHPITGVDRFGSLSTYEERFYAELVTGEIQILTDGAKSSVKEIWNRTYTTKNAECPDAIIQFKATDEDDWFDAADTNGTISVTTTACGGTGTAWSNVIDPSAGSLVEFDLPCLATQARIYIIDAGGTISVMSDYTITDDRQITLTSNLEHNHLLLVHWDNEPHIRVVPGDYIETSEGFHRILSIMSSARLLLDWYPHETLVGHHRPAKQVRSGESETVVGVNHNTDIMQLRLLVIPRRSLAGPAVIDAYGLSIVHVPGGPRVLKASR